MEDQCYVSGNLMGEMLVLTTSVMVSDAFESCSMPSGIGRKQQTAESKHEADRIRGSGRWAARDITATNSDIRGL